MPTIHPSACVDPQACLAQDVTVGPGAVIEADVKIDAGCSIQHNAHIGRWTHLGPHNQVYPGAVIGLDPQDFGYNGEEAWTIIGGHNVFREGVTVHRGHRAHTETVIGDHNYLMANSHVAHNCLLGNHITLVNGALLAGHVEVGDRVIISGNCQVHQFVRIGRLAFLRGGSGANRDVPPFCVHDGIGQLRALNRVGLQRQGYTPEQVRSLVEAFKILFRQGLPRQQALDRLTPQVATNNDIAELVQFIRSSQRGIARGRREAAK